VTQGMKAVCGMGKTAAKRKHVHFQLLISLFSHCFHKMWINENKKKEGKIYGENTSLIN
jgi:hypothetical protein